MNRAASDRRLDACRRLLLDARYGEASKAIDRIVDTVEEIDQVEALRIQGRARQGEGRFEQALESFQRCEALAYRLGDDEARGMALLDAANVYRRTGRDDAAFDAIEKVVPLDVPTILRSAGLALLSDLYAQAGATQYAERLSDYAMQAIIGEYTDPAVIQQAMVQEAMAGRRLALARLAALQGQHYRALYALEAIEVDARYGSGSVTGIASEAEAIIRKHAARAPAVDVIAGGSLLAVGRFADARSRFMQAREEAVSRGDIAVQVEAEAGLGKVDLAEGNLAEALMALNRAVDLAETWLSDFEVVALRSGLRTTLVDVHGVLVDAAARCGDARLAWQTMDRIRAREFLASLATPGYSPQITGPEAQQLIHLDRRIAALTAKLETAPALSLASGEARIVIGRVREERKALLDDKVRLLDASLRGRPALGLASARLASEEEIWHVLGDDTALVQYFFSADASIAVVLADGVFSVQDLGIHPDAVANRVQRFSRHVARPPTQKHDNSWRDTARDLFVGLWAPLVPALRDVQRVCIVPHGPLTELSFAAIGDDTPLASQIEITYAPSASILATVTADPARPFRDIAVFADPLPETPWHLPGARREADAIERTVFAVRATIGAAATPRAVLDAARTADVLHLACHAEFDVHRPLLSALLLAADDGTPARLEAHTIGAAKIGARLVVLSACETGRSDREPAAELQGLVRAFLVAGARAVIGSLWKVDDPATARLMTRFYESLAEGLGPGAALRVAQAEMNQSDLAHPWYWAAFGLYGDGRRNGFAKTTMVVTQ